jgi:protein-S-isoprenylcysteine O-methyltransferase Ste14
LRGEREPVEEEAAMDVDLDTRAATDTRTPSVMARPPRLFLGTLLLGLAFDRLLPLPVRFSGSAWVHWTIGASLIVGGLALFAAGIRNFSRASTPVPTIEPTRVLVTTGIHGWTRNPIYVGMFLIYGGIGVAVPSPWMLILVVPLVLAVRYGVIAREEAYLETRFGDAYRSYKTRVRRWV